jgi:hypothetical protein
MLRVRERGNDVTVLLAFMTSVIDGGNIALV